jgi:hypothetical protein
MPKAAYDKGETMKSPRVAGISARYWFSVLGWRLSQDAAHEMDKGAIKTEHFVKPAGSKVGHAAKSGVKVAGHRTRLDAKCSVKGVKKPSKKIGEGIKNAAST